MSRTAARLEFLSKLTVLLSAAVAVGGETYLGSLAWRPLLPLALGAAVVAFLLARLRAAAAWALVLPAVYLAPAIFLGAIGQDYFTNQAAWMAALLGAILGAISFREWSLPARWKLALVFWALVVAVTWPVVVARECDFRWSMLWYEHIGNSGLGGNGLSQAVWVQYVALTYLLGILWFDALFHSFTSADPVRFRRVIALPLGVGALLASAVAVYQGTVDVYWLSDHQWPIIHRAAGTLVDGDAFGALASFWSSAFVGFAGPAGLAWAAFGALGAAVSWGGLWATGSRMGLLGGLIGLTFLLAYGALLVWRRNRMRALTSGAELAVVAISLAALVLLAGPPKLKLPWEGRLFASQSPLARAVEALPSLERTSLERFALFELWDRGTVYGSASLLMVEQYPAVGVGIGSYHNLFPDYSYHFEGVRRNFDNAQSWYRHLLAEMGVAGSLGWIAWVILFAWLLVTTHAEGANELPAAALKGSFVAIAAICAVSMPTQNAAVSMTFWPLAFWYLMLIPESQGLERLRKGRLASRGWAWIAVWLVVLGCAGGTAYVGWKDLRPPYRALWANWDYPYGLYDLEKPPNGEPFRWTKQHAVDVFPVPASERDVWLKLTFWIHHPDAAEHPVQVKIWRKDPDKERLIVDMRLSDDEPVTRYVKVPPLPHPRMMLETWVSRTWTPAAFGRPDRRQLGLALADWTFVSAPPRGAVVIR